MAGDRWYVIAADLLTGAVRDEVPFNKIAWDPEDHADGSFTASIQSEVPQAAAVTEGNTVLHVCHGATIFASFEVRTTQWQDRQLNLSGGTLRSYFGRRLLRADKTYPGIDQLAIAQDLHSYVNADHGIGTTFRATPATSGVLRTVAYTASSRPLIGQTLDELAQLADGFDWDVTCEWSGSNTIARYFDVWYPSRGTVTNLVWEHGKNCRVTSYTRDASLLANRVDVSGNGAGSTPPIATAEVTPSGYPRLEVYESLSATGESTILSAAATAQLSQDEVPVETATVELTGDGDTDITQWALGDQVSIYANEGWLQLDGLWQVVTPHYTLDAAGAGSRAATVDVARALPGQPIRSPNWFRDQAKVDKRLRNLERR